MNNDWVLIYSTNKLYEAEILKEYLADNELEVVVMNKQDSFYLFGDIEVYCSPDDVMKARLLVEKFKIA